MVEAWWDRNDAIGAWQYSIPPDATPVISIGIDSWAARPKFLSSRCAVPLAKLSRLRHRRGGDLFVHLFTGMHFVTGAIGPSRVYATGGLRFWKDGRDVPDVMLGLYDYPKTDQHPAFNLSLRVNFVDGAGESSGFRFVGSEGIMHDRRQCDHLQATAPRRARLTVGTFPKRRRISSCVSIAKSIR